MNEGIKRRQWRWWLLDGLAGAALVITGITIALMYIPRQGGGQFIEKTWWYGPSAMFACGKGLAMPPIEKIPALNAFLTQQTDSFSCEELPADLKLQPLYAFHKSHRYLMLAGGWIWRILGISWNNAAWLTALSCGLSALLVYGIFRLAMNPVFASLGALLYVSFPIHLSVLTRLRDYNKAPFVFGAVLLLGYLVKSKRSPKTVLLSSALLGLILGVGLGFRLDLSLFVYIALITLLFFLPGRVQDTWWLRGAAAALLVICYLIPSAPIRQSLREENSSAPHNILGGIAWQFETELGIGGAPYQYMPLYLDALIYSTTASYSYRTGGITEPIDYKSSEYSACGAQHVREYLKTYPADMLLRFYASALSILEESPHRFCLNPNGLDPVVLKGRDLTGVVAWHIMHWGRWYVVAVVVLLAVWNLRLACAVFALFMMLGMYPALQFEPRHYFHLSFLPLWFIGAFWSNAARGAWRLFRPDNRTAAAAWLRENVLSCRTLGKTAGFAAVCILGLWIPLFVLRVYQSSVMGGFYQRLNAAEWTPVPCSETEDKDLPGWILLHPQQYFGKDAFSARDQQTNFHTEYVVVDIAPMEGHNMYLEAQYSADMPANNLSMSFSRERLPIPSTAARVIFPVYELSEKGNERFFETLHLSASDRPRVKGMFLIKDLGSFTLLPSLALKPEPSDNARYLRFTPHPAPHLLRSYAARFKNSILNGGFEQWEMGTPAQWGAAPGRMTVAQEASTVSEGKWALRQTWQAADCGETPTKLLYCLVKGLAPNTPYELMADAWYDGPNRVSVKAWQLVPTEDPKVMRCASLGEVIRVRPGKYMVPSSGVFVTQPVNPVMVIIAVCSQGQSYPDTALWDAFRLTPLWMR